MKMRPTSVLSHSIVIFLFFIAALDKISCQNYRLSSGVVPSIYDLHITIDLDTLRFTGTETIHVRSTQPTSTIELHLLDLSVDDVQVIEGANAIPIASTDYSNDTQKFRIRLEQSLSADSGFMIKMNFEGEIKDDMKGLYRSSYYESTVPPGIKYMATTFSAATFARKIFPCFDEPGLKSVFNLAVTNKNNYVTLANTKSMNVETNELENGEIWKTTSFEPTPIMSTYLLAFAVSEFKNITQFDPMEFSVYSSQKAISGMQYAHDTGVTALKILEDYVGHKYTLGKMDLIAVDDFLMGAMENWGLIEFKSSRIMNPVGKRNLRKIQEVKNIISHELAHMFFGNQVTFEYWNNVWLNEGFASYLEYVIADKIFPDWHILDYFLVNRMHTVMLQDVKPKTHPMTRPINTLEEISKIYDFVAYPKAASVIRMVEHIMGPEIFRKALNVYIAERSYKSTTDEQFYEILEEVRRNSSDANYPGIPGIFRSWANNPSFPILNVEFSPENKSVLITQELFVPLIDTKETSNFNIMYNYAASSRGANGFYKTSPTNWVLSATAVQHSLDSLNEDERWVIFNIQQTGYYRVNYDDRNWNAIIDELNSEKFVSIHELNRAQLLDDSFNLARYDYLDFNIALNLLKYLRQETSLVPLVAATKSIDFLLSFMDQQVFFKDLRNILLSIVDEVYVKINNASLPLATENEDYYKLTRLHVNSFACKVGAATCLKDSTKKLFLFDHEFNELDINERPFFYCGVLGEDLAALNWMQLKMKILKSNGNEEFYRDNQEEFNEIFHAFSACDTNLDRVERLLNDIFNYDNETLSYANVSNENAVQVVSNLIMTSSDHRSLMMKFYTANFAAVNLKVPFKDTLRMFAQSINTQSELEKFRALAIDAGLTVDEAVDTVVEIEENIRWMIVKAPEIAKWVETEKSSGVNIKISSLTFTFSILTFLLMTILH